MPQQIQWRRRFDGQLPDAAQLQTLAAQLDISPAFATLLWQRGLQDAVHMDRFLSPHLRNLAPLAQWPDVTAAAKTLYDALQRGESLLVWGDYDVDGITSTSLVLDFLRFHGIEARYHIPSRLKAGYGLATPVVEEYAAQGIRCILTVDCGISDIAPVARARELGLTVVLSDHHLPGEVLPDANAICNPRLGPCPCPDLAGVGVAFLLMAACNVLFAEKTGKKADMREYLDLVALGTLADVVELSEQNRILAKNGLLCLGAAKRPGLAALKEVCNQAPTAMLQAGQVVYTLAPRINAAGRMGKSDIAVQLMLTHERNEAATLARELDSLNLARREEEKQIMVQALAQAKTQVEEGRMGLVLYGETWHPGIIGIVASRIVEAFHRPAVILCADRGAVKGSGRSVSSFDLHAALTDCSDLFMAFGGHKQAAGVTLALANLDAFASRFAALAEQRLGTEAAPPTVSIDADLEFSQAADYTFLKELELLHPFGPGNPEPVFLSPPVIVKSVQTRNGGLNLTEFTHK